MRGDGPDRSPPARRAGGVSGLTNARRFAIPQRPETVVPDMNTTPTTEHGGRGKWITAAVIALIVVIAVVLLASSGGGGGGGGY